MKEKKTRIFFLLKIQRQFSFEKQSPMEIFIILVLCALFRYVNSVLCYSSTRISYPIVNKSSFESLERLIRENLRGEEQDICDLWITIKGETADSSPSKSLGVPRSPLESLGVPRSPLESLGVPRSPLESLGVPWSPSESLGVPWSPLKFSAVLEKSIMKL